MKKIPFSFVLDELQGLEFFLRPMFGCTALYTDLRIIFILREKDNHLEDNGVWLATSPEFHESLKKEFPAMRSISLFGGGPTSWQNLPSDSTDFEASVLRACALVLKGDLRIGKIPKKKSVSKKSANS